MNQIIKINASFGHRPFEALIQAQEPTRIKPSNQIQFLNFPLKRRSVFHPDTHELSHDGGTPQSPFQILGLENIEKFIQDSF